jgi:hypothetical protein
MGSGRKDRPGTLLTLLLPKACQPVSKTQKETSRLTGDVACGHAVSDVLWCGSHSSDNYAQFSGTHTANKPPNGSLID